MSVFSDNPITTSPTTSKHRSGFCFDLRMKSLSISTSFRQLVAKSGPCTLTRDLAEVSIGFPYAGFISIATRRFWHGEINGRALKPGILRSENMWPWQQIMNMFAPSSTALSFVFRGRFQSKKHQKQGSGASRFGKYKTALFLVLGREWGMIYNNYQHL